MTDLHEQINQAAAIWAEGNVIASWRLAQGDSARQLAMVWGKQIGDAVMAVAQPALDAKDAEIARLTAKLAEQIDTAAWHLNRQAKRELGLEATIARVKALAKGWLADGPADAKILAERTLKAIDQPDDQPKGT